MQGRIKNKALLEATICGHKQVIETIETIVDPIKIEFESIHPCKHYIDGGKIHYEFKVKNRSEVCVNDLIFKDLLEQNSEYVMGSFMVNGCSQKPTVRGNEICYLICHLGAHETMTICFEVKARDHRPCHGQDQRPINTIHGEQVGCNCNRVW